MCGGGGGYSKAQSDADKEKARQDAEAERLAADNEAQNTANQETAAARRRKRANSLLATGAQGVTDSATTTSVLATGKNTLGA